jgi:hypothetical protein
MCGVSTLAVSLVFGSGPVAGRESGPPGGGVGAGGGAGVGAAGGARAELAKAPAGQTPWLDKRPRGAYPTLAHEQGWDLLRFARAGRATATLR